MDKSWTRKPRNSTEYLVGLNQFLDFAFAKAVAGDRIKCPCPKCGFAKWQTREVAFEHLICKPFPQNYVTWTIHGERNILPNSINNVVIQDTLPPENPVELLINEAFGGLRHDGVDVGPSQVAGGEERLNDDPASNDKDFFELLRDGSQELFEGSKYSKLEFLLKLYRIKCLSGLSDKGMTMILDLLRDAFTFARIPHSFYEAKKTISKLCLDYIKIDACPNDCMLFWGNDANEETCKYCHTSRWKPDKKRNEDLVSATGKKKTKKKTKKPAKILRYFSLKPRLQRLFMCSKIAKYMRWHAEDSNKDGIMRHPIEEKIELAVSESTVDESEISPNDAVGKVLGKEHPGRVRCLGLGATPSNTFRQANLRPGNIRIVNNNAGCSSSGCQEKYNQLMNTLKAYMIMKEGSIPEQFAGIFASTPTTPRDAASGPVSPRDARRSSGASNPRDSN